MFAYDTETTGVALWNGCLPFFAAGCDEEGLLTWWEWDVDPFSRKPKIPLAHIEELDGYLCSDEMVAHNANFDLVATERLLKKVDPSWEVAWDFTAIDDTLIAIHCLRNLWQKNFHGLKALRSIFLQIPPTKEEEIRRATNKARGICRTKRFIEKHGEWRTADATDAHWPGIKRQPKAGWWVFDMWLPRAIATLAPEFLPEEEHERSFPTVQQSGTTSKSDRPHDQGRGLGKRRGTNHKISGGNYRTQQTDTNSSSGCANLEREPERNHHSWFTVLREYALEDVESTIALWWVLRDAIREEGLWDQYLERRKLLEITYDMEIRGVTVLNSLPEEVERYSKESQSYAERATKLVPFEVNLNSPQQLCKVLYEHFELPILKRTDKGQASTDEATLTQLQDEGNEKSRRFIDNLLRSRRSAKTGDYADAYDRWSVREVGTSRKDKVAATNGDLVHREIQQPKRHSRIRTREDTHQDQQYSLPAIHSSYFITGTKFTRQSCSNPNLMNIGTGKEDEEGEIKYNLRTQFGPAPGRIWIGIDYSNLELRLWGYLCGNREFIECFERGENVHLMIAREIHPKLQKLSDNAAKETKPYKHTKNGDFAIIYGATPKTADLTYKVTGAYNKLTKRFPEVRAFTRELHKEVTQLGYIETLTGYRLYIPPEDPHKAVSGKIQGTAGSIIGRAMIDCYDYLQDNPHLDTHIIMQVHDELVFDAPASLPNVKDYLDLPQKLMQLMAQQGDKLGIPTPVSGELIKDNWSHGEPIDAV